MQSPGGLVTRTCDDRRTLLEAAITLGTELTQGGGRGAIERNFIASQPRLFDA